MDNRIKSEVIISRDNTLYDKWVNNESQESIKMFVFEVENPNEVLNGIKAKVREVGPFVFKIQRLKEKVSFSMDKTIVSFAERKVYLFDELMSTGSLDDNITVINLQFMILNPMLTQLTQSSNTVNSRSNNSVLNTIFDTFRDNVFTSKSIREILFESKDDPKLKQITQYFTSLSRNGIYVPKLLPKNFSLFDNNTENKFEVLTGYKTGLYSKILKWNDQTNLKVWTGRQCNAINGTNGYQFTPPVHKLGRIYEYHTDICRSIEMGYDNTYDIDGISIYRFSPVDNIFYGPKSNPKNRCYCLSPNNPEKCNFIGIVDLSSCRGSPLILSNPHFWRTSDILSKSVVGLNADEQLHQSFIEVEPISGFVIYKTKRYQLNVHVKKCPLNQNLGKTLKEGIIPLVWFEEVSELDDYTKDTIKLFFVWPNKYEELIVFGLIAFGGLLLMASLCCCCCCRGSKKKAKLHSLD
ncbi:platelet glycoprotein 4-like [Oppia nitens]|uniref:platelet glycoprotein 4-like n=1 Tax=Oppia nitens TaxID=1686743 RepID=UPI0023DA64D9|nr:platelet glycoprotein 4-like [Oppia nitens]